MTWLTDVLGGAQTTASAFIGVRDTLAAPAPTAPAPASATNTVAGKIDATVNVPSNWRPIILIGGALLLIVGVIAIIRR